MAVFPDLLVGLDPKTLSVTRHIIMAPETRVVIVTVLVQMKQSLNHLPIRIQVSINQMVVRRESTITILRVRIQTHRITTICILVHWPP